MNTSPRGRGRRRVAFALTVALALAAAAPAFAQAVRITSTPANGTHYVVGETIVTRLDLPAHLFAGNPLASTMKLDIGGVERLATGITPYSFALAGADYTYTVADGDVDVDGISIPANAIATNGGPWRTSGAAIINLNNAALPNQAAHQVIARAAYISATSPSPLAEATLDGATVTVSLDGVSFLNSATTSSFMPVTTVPNLTITNAGSISAGDTSATLTLAQSGNFDADGTLAVSVAASALSGASALSTNAVPVLPDTPTASISSTSPAALTEANLHQARVTVALANAVFGSGVGVSSFDVATAIPGVSVALASNVSAGDTTATLTLAFTGGFSAVTPLAVKVLAAAHSGSADITSSAVNVTPTPGIVLDPTSLALEEDPAAGGATNANVGTYTVALTANPRTAAGGSCAVFIEAVSNNAGLIIDTGSTPQTKRLVFDQTDWNTPQTITVTAASDADALDVAATISHSRVASICVGDFFGRPSLPALTVAVNDDETPSAAIASPAILTAATLNGATVTVSLSLTTFASGVGASSFELVTGASGVSIASATATAGGTTATTTLSYSGTLAADAKLAVKVLAAAHAGDADLTTAQIDVLLADTTPSFGSATVSEQYLPAGVAMAPIQLPAASGGNGAITHWVDGLPAGLKFDATGTDAGGCAAGDFPPGTALSWATAPRTVCGTPVATGRLASLFLARDADSNRSPDDRAVLDVIFTVYGASIASTSPASLTEANLNTATVSLSLAHATFASGVAAANFELVTTIPGLSISQVSGATAGGTTATLTLAFAGDFSASQTLAVRVKAAALDRASDVTTGAVPVDPQELVDTAPSFGSATVSEQYLAARAAMAPLQFPAASGGNGTITHWADGLPAGLKFDATGTDAGGCSAGDFPPGTDASWATAPRTVCGTPVATGRLASLFLARDADSNRSPDDRAALDVIFTVYGASIASTSPASLTEANLNNATVSLSLARTTFASGVTAASFELVTDIPGLSLSLASVVPMGTTTATLALAFAGDFNASRTLAVKVKAAAHSRAGDLTTGAVTVPPQGVTDTAPGFGGATVPEKFFAAGAAIAPFQLPAASGGNGAVSYTADGLPLGLKFDATGTDARGCSASDFPPGTESSWATAPRTVCGAPAATGRRASLFLARDADSNRSPDDRAVLDVVFTVYGASIASTNPASLTEANLHNATVSLSLAQAAFAGGVTAASFELVTDIPGLSVSQVSGAAVNTSTAALTLAFTGDFSATSTLAVKVKAAAHDRPFDATTRTVAVATADADTEPAFPAAFAADRSFLPGVAIAPFQIPAATGGNGAVSYAVAGLPAGLKFDATGADAGGCAAGDFPPGTASSWASAPRTVCGSPARNVVMVVVATATDEDGDVARLTFRVTVAGPAAALATVPATLTEANLDGAALTVALERTTFESGTSAASFELATDIPGVSIAGVAAGATSTTLTLAFAGDFSAVETLAVAVKGSAHSGSASDLAAGTLTVPPTPGIALNPASLALEEDPAAGGATDANVGEYTVALTADPTTAAGDGCTVVVMATSTPDAAIGPEAWPQTKLLEFDGANWNTPQTVTVAALHDADGVDTTISIRHSRAGQPCAGGYFGRPSLAALPVTVHDDDTPTAAITSPTLISTQFGWPIRVDRTVTVTLFGSTFAAGVDASDFQLSYSGVDFELSSASATPGAATATLRVSRLTGLTSSLGSLAVKVLASAHAGDTDLDTPPISAVYQDTAPSFGSASVPGQQFPRGEAIAPFQIPAASGGNGAIAYAAAGLPAGLKFDATGTDADGCAAADFPPGTAASWATAARTVCGTPTGIAGAIVAFHARDSDTNRANSDRASLSVTMTIARAILFNANPSPLAEGGLNGATVDLQMYNAAFGSGAGAASFELVTAIPGLSIASVSAISGGFATLTLAYRGDFTGPQTLAVRIKAAAHNRGFDIVTEALAVAPSDTAPAFGTSTVAHQFFAAGRPIAPLQLPAASGGDGAVAYSMPSLAAVPGLKFDATGADAGGCAAGDFPAGTAASWATAPRTLCGTPAAADAAGARTVSLLAHDADSNRGPGDRAALGFDITVYGASITATSPSPLAEGGLNGATVDVRLVNAAFVVGVAAASFDLATDIPNVAVSQVAGAAVGGATTTLTLAFAGDFSAVETLAVTVRAAAHNRASDVTTGTVPVDPQGLVDTAPSFASSAPDRYYPEGAAIAPFQLPAAVGGNGALDYAVAALGRGLKFDATGTDAGGCAAGDFPPGTAASWATAPRTVCGTPTGMGNMFVFLNAHDADTNRSAGDRASLQFEIFVFGAAIASTSPAALAEANLHGAALRVRLHGSNFWFDGGVAAADFELATDVPGASISAVSGGARFATEATLTLAFDGDIRATSTLAVKVSASATNSSRDVTTNAVAVAATAEADTEPVFPAGPQARSYLTNVAIAPFQIPAAAGGNGVLAYAAAGLPDGLKFDATGTDAGGCAASDFPSGTAALWATAPRTICGTPTRAVESVVVVSATDEDGDVGRLTLRIAAAAPAAALGETVPATLAEASLHGATMVVTLSRTAFASGVTTASFELVTAIADLSIASVSAVAEGDTQATLTLAFTGDFGRAPTIAVKVLAAAHREAGDLTTGAVPVVPNPGVWLSRDSLALNEAPGADNANRGTYAVALDTPPTGCFSVAVGASSDNPDVAVSPSNLSFNTNSGSGQFWSTPRAFTVTAAQDVDGMHDAATISHRILSNCDGAGYPLSLSIGSVSVTVADDETSVAIAPTPAALTETNLDGATLALSLVNAAFSAGAPAAGVGAFELVSTSTIPNLSISQVSGVTAGGTTATLTLAFPRPPGDFRGLPTLAVRVPAASLQGGVALLSNAVTVAAAPGVTVSRTSLALHENPGATNANRGTYTIVADGPPTGCAAGIGVAVSSDNADVAANPALLTFTTSTWNTAQTVTATAGPDDDGVDDAAVLSHGIATACDGAGYVAALAIAGVDVAVDDAQTPAVVLDADPSTSGVDAGPLALVEGHATNAARTFSVQLATEPTQATTVTLGSLDAGAATIDGGPLVFATTTWDTAQTVTARAADDDDAADESVALFATSTTATASEYSGVAARLTAAVDDDETRAVVLSAATLSVPEADSATYTARLSAQPVGGNVAVAITGAGDGIATSPTSLTFTPSNWNTPQTVRASAANDANGINESVTLTHTAIGADYGGAATARIVVTATDDDAPSLRVAPTSLTLAEGARATYTVRLNAQPAAQVTVTVGGTTAAVAADTDGGAPGAQTTMTFSNSTWSTPQTVTVSAPTDDDATNATTTLTHAVTGTGGYASLGPSARPGVQVTVNDGDEQGLVIDADPSTGDADAGPLAVDENDSAEYTVRLATRPTGTVTVTATSPDAALALDTDASPQTLSLTFSTSTWNAAQTVTARAADDDDGGDETVAVAHAAMGGDYGGGVSATLSVAVADDDPRLVALTATSTLAGLDENDSATYTVALSTQPTGPVTVAIASSDASAATVDADDAVGGLQGTVTFTASTWNTARTVTVSALDDDDGFDETITLTHDPSGADYESGVSNATFAFTLDDDDPRGVVLSTSTLSVQEGGSATYTARLRTQPVGGNVTVTITGAGGGIAASPTSLTFTGANWNTPQQVRVSAARDGDSMDETATLTHTPSGAGTDYAAGAATAQIVVTATDIDTPGLQVSPTQLAVAEGASRAYTVRLNTDPLGAVTVTATSNDAAVTLDADSTPQERTLTFDSSNWATPQTVTASAVEDDNGTDESVTVTHAASGAAAYTGLDASARPSVSVAVDDNDARGIVIDADPSTPNDVDAGPLAVTENQSAEYAVRLATQPTGTVTVTATSPDAALAVDSDASPQTRTLTFTTSTWATAQTVTARALDDDDGGDETTAIAHAADGADYDDVSASLAAETADDDPRRVTLTATSTLAGLDENDSATYTVALSTRPTGPVTVAISGSDASAATVDADDAVGGLQGTVTFTASTWNTARTVTVSALDDDDGFDETITLTHDPSGADYGSAPNATFAFTLDDDDPRGVVLSTSTLMVQENGSATYTAKLRTQPSGGTVTVAIASGGGGITANPTSLTFNGANWNTPRQVRLSAAEDGNSMHESVVVRHTPSGADYGGVPPADLTATAVDNDRPGLRVSPTRLAVDENQSAEYTVRLNTDPLGSVTVTATSDDAAVALDADSTPQERTLTFNSSSWDTPQTVTASAVEDDNATDESATVTHAASGVSAYTGLVGAALPSVQVAVDDNDARALVIDADPSTDDVDAGPLAATENQSAEYTVRLATQPTGTVTVTATSPDPALAVDSDASPQERTLTFTTNTWNTAQTVTARALDDDDGGNETTAIAHAADGADYDDVSASLAAETADDDPRRVLAGSPIALDEGGMASSTARLSTRPTGTVTVAITDDHPDVTVAPPTALTFDAATWQTAQTFTIRAGEDLDGEHETATLTFDPRGADYDGAPSATSTVNLADDDPRGVTLSESALAVPEGGSATYTVRLDTRPAGGNVTVTVGGTGSGISASPTALTFTGTNWNAPRTVRVSAAEDDNPTHESVDLTHSVSGADYGREGVAAGAVRATATDNDTPSLRVAPTALALVEEGADGFYAVRLNTPPSGDVVVTVGGATAAVSVDADGGAPGAQTAMTFTTTDWATAQTVTVGAPADDDAANATTTLTHAVAGPGDYAALGPAARPGVRVTVEDDDAQALVIDADPTTPNDAEPGPLALNEQPGHADNAKEYTVRLATQPTGTVQVSIESGDRAVAVDGDSTPRTRTLTFSTMNWSAAQTVTATAAQDDDASAETVAISHEASGGGYGDVSADLTATTADDDTPALLLATSTLAASGVAEGGTQTYTVRLATEPSGTVTVAATATATATARVEVDMDGGQAGAQSSLRFDAANWSAPRTATVRGLPDDDAADGTATLRHSASGADYGGVDAAAETFAVADDDAPALLASATAVIVNEGSTAAYTVRLATLPVGGEVTVAATSTNASAATVQPAQLRFGAGDWDVPKTFRVHGAQAGSATISHSASGADYGGAAAPPVAATVRGTQAAGVRIEPPTLALREGRSGAYAVRLNTDPGGDATVTATSGSALVEIDRDATPLVRELTFTTDNWSTAQTVTATALADDGVGDETATVTHAVTGYAGVASAPSLTVRVADDDAPGLLFEPAEGLRLEESGAVGTYTARLRFAPSAAVAVAVSSDDAGVAVDTDGGTPLDQDTLAFDATNWSTAQTVTVRAVPDADAASETATLTHAASGAGSGYEGVTAAYAVRVSDANAAPAPTGVAASAAGPTSLAVRWTPSPGAEGHAVQWRRAGQAWSAARQLTLPGDASSARIDGLATGAEYEVRVLGLNRGDPGDPSSSARATPRAVGPGNRAPVAVAGFADRTLILGAALAIDLRGAFWDPDGDALTYWARSLNPSAVEATVSGAELRLRAAGIGPATVHVYARDPGGLVGSLTLGTRVVRRAALSADDAQAPEGGAARLAVQLSPARSTSTRIVWTLALDADAATADADDLAETSGEATIPAGETRAEIGIEIADDMDIEPAREWFEVSLSAPDGCCGPAARARVTVLEGTCDRTPAVRDALRGSASCDAPTPATLAAVERLALSGAGAGSLRADDFAGLSGLRALLLDGNGLETLPDGLFAGLSGLRELSLEDNPGAPFALAVELARTDADAWAPGPATVQAQFALGAPFALRSELSAEPAAAGLPATVRIGAGATTGLPFAVAASTSTLRLLAGAAPLPTARCGEAPCFRGMATAPGEPLTLYRLPPRAQPAPDAEPLQGGDGLRLPLASLILPGDGDPGALRWRASSSDETVATARVVGGHLVVEPEPGGEGAAEIVLEATDEAGLAATLRFEVQVEFHWPSRQASGWRAGALIDAARAAAPPEPR